MNRPLALFDIDKTVFDGMSYLPLVEAQIAEGLLDPEVGVLAHAAMDEYKNGTLDYELLVKKLIDIYAKGLAGSSVDDIAASTDRFFTENPHFFGYAKPTIDLLSATHEVVFVTGSPQFTAQAVAKYFGVQHHISTMLGTTDGTLDGTVSSYIATRHEKKAAIDHLIAAHPHSGSFAFGDSEGDIEMLRAVEHPVCIQPTTGLAETAAKHGWTIVAAHEDVTSPQALAVVRQALPA